MYTKDNLIDGIWYLLTSTIANNRYYKNRCRGFKAELEIINHLKQKNISYKNGGQFIFSNKNKAQDPNNFIYYVTFSRQKKEEYVAYYKEIKKICTVQNLYFIEIQDIEEWSSVELSRKDANGRIVCENIPKPVFKIFKFKNDNWEEIDFNPLTSDLILKKRKIVCALKTKEFLSYFKNYSLDELIEPYCNRFFIDFMLHEYKISMIDIDVFSDQLGIIEVKEKTPIIRNEIKTAFGWDSRRFSWYMYLQIKTDLKVQYIIREIDTIENRNFVKWKIMSLDDFMKCTGWSTESAGGGGAGMLLAPYAAFEDF